MAPLAAPVALLFFGIRAVQVILGGLVTSTLLNLIILPALAWKWGGFGNAVEEDGP